NEREVSEIVRETSSNHLDNVQRAGNPDSEILSVELLRNAFNAADQPFAIFALDERDDIARFVVLGNQKTLPKWAVFGIGKVFRAVRQTSHACHGFDRLDFFG